MNCVFEKLAMSATFAISIVFLFVVLHSGWCFSRLMISQCSLVLYIYLIKDRFNNIKILMYISVN